MPSLRISPAPGTRSAPSGFCTRSKPCPILADMTFGCFIIDIPIDKRQIMAWISPQFTRVIRANLIVRSSTGSSSGRIRRKNEAIPVRIFFGIASEARSIRYRFKEKDIKTKSNFRIHSFEERNTYSTCNYARDVTWH